MALISSTKEDNMLCKVCQYRGSDIRLVGCGCTIHAVSSEAIALFQHDFICMGREIQTSHNFVEFCIWCVLLELF